MRAPTEFRQLSLTCHFNHWATGAEFHHVRAVYMVSMRAITDSHLDGPQRRTSSR